MQNVITLPAFAIVAASNKPSSDGLAIIFRQASRLRSTSAGGEEFIAYLPGMSESDGMAIATRVRVAFEQSDWAALGMGQAVTVSGGVAAVTDEPHGIERAFRSADEALYMAKASGRNKVVTEGPSVIGKTRTPTLPIHRSLQAV